MGKKRKKNKKRHYLSEWDGHFFGKSSYGYGGFSLYSTKPEDIHKIATEVFGQTYYVDFTESS